MVAGPAVRVPAVDAAGVLPPAGEDDEADDEDDEDVVDEDDEVLVAGWWAGVSCAASPMKNPVAPSAPAAVNALNARTRAAHSSRVTASWRRRRARGCGGVTGPGWRTRLKGR